MLERLKIHHKTGPVLLPKRGVKPQPLILKFYHPFACPLHYACTTILWKRMNCSVVFVVKQRYISTLVYEVGLHSEKKGTGEKK